MSIRIEGDMQALKDALKNLEADQLKTVAKQIGFSLKDSTRERFSDQEDPEGTPWTKSIRARAEGGVTLTDTGALRNSIRFRTKGDGVAIGTDLAYANAHQYGYDGIIKAKSSRGLRFKIGNRWINKRQVKIRIPARPFMGIGKDDLQEINDIVMAAVERCVKHD